MREPTRRQRERKRHPIPQYPCALSGHSMPSSGDDSPLFVQPTVLTELCVILPCASLLVSQATRCESARRAHPQQLRKQERCARGWRSGACH